MAPEKATLFLTPQQALRAVCLDLRQYAPQIPLMCDILRLISGRDSIIRDPRNGVVWMRRQDRRQPQQIPPAALVTTTCHRLEHAVLSLETWAAICRRVFQTRVSPSVDAATGERGLSVFTAMASFRCRQCGHCCRRLDFRYELTAKDVERWRRAGREDILAWVGVLKKDNGAAAYQIWVVPGTNRFTDGCPFLRQGSSNHVWVCGIHEVKPMVCRQYPVTRKHAGMTGCPGFDE